MVVVDVVVVVEFEVRWKVKVVELKFSEFVSSA